MNVIRRAVFGIAIVMCLGASQVALADACAGKAGCFDAGPFVAEVTQVTVSWNNSHRVHFVRLNVRFRNTGTSPVMLALPWRSACAVTDNYGNRYGIDWRYPQRVTGIGYVGHGHANANFVLAPGSSRVAGIIFSRSPGNTPVGNAFTADFPVEQLQPIPGQQSVRSVGQYSLDFSGLSSGAMGIATVATPDSTSQPANAVEDAAQRVDNLQHGINSLLDAFKKH